MQILFAFLPRWPRTSYMTCGHLRFRWLCLSSTWFLQGCASDEATSTSQGASGPADQSSTDVLENLASQGWTDRVHLQLLSKVRTIHAAEQH